MLNLKNRLGQYQFNTLVSVSGADIFNLSQFEVVKRINSTNNFFSKNPKVIIADPFLFTHKDELYLFYEEQLNLRGKGVIKMTKTADLMNWSEPKLILEESFHLSYPNVFEMDNQIYMLPETGHDNSVRLYKPDKDLTEWKYFITLLKGKHFVDSSIIRKDNIFYLFTTEYINTSNELRIYFSSSIEGEWKEHPNSPVAVGDDTARCAGSLFYYNGILYRPCQLSATKYGSGVDIYEVTTLNEKEYQELKTKRIIPNDREDYKLGGHHFSTFNYHNKQIVATDILKLKFNFWEIVRRISDKFSSN